LLKRGQERAGIEEGESEMKELANSFAQLAAIIMLLITLAVSTAAVSQWASADTPDTNAGAATQQQQLIADTR
jgi:hypothetical protein